MGNPRPSLGQDIQGHNATPRVRNSRQGPIWTSTAFTWLVAPECCLTSTSLAGRCFPPATLDTVDVSVCFPRATTMDQQDDQDVRGKGRQAYHLKSLGITSKWELVIMQFELQVQTMRPH